MNMTRLLDYFFVLRPILFFAGWTTTLAGYLAASQSYDPFDGPVTSGSLIGIMISSAMVMGAGFIVNQIKDKDTDQINKKLFYLSDGVLPYRLVVLEAWVLAMGSLAIAAWISMGMLIIHLLSLIWITAIYNLRPFELKNKPFGSLFANMGMGVFAFLYGWYLTPLSWQDFFTSVVPYALFNTCLCILTTIPDFEGDRQASKRTLCVVYGIPATVGLAFTLWVAAFLSAAYNMDWIILIPCILSVPLMLKLVIKRNAAAAILSIKFTGLFFSLVVGIFFPWYIIMIILFFFGTRWYYRNRFGMIYPNFKSE